MRSGATRCSTALAHAGRGKERNRNRAMGGSTVVGIEWMNEWMNECSSSNTRYAAVAGKERQGKENEEEWKRLQISSVREQTAARTDFLLQFSSLVRLLRAVCVSAILYATTRKTTTSTTTRTTTTTHTARTQCVYDIHTRLMDGLLSSLLLSFLDFFPCKVDCLSLPPLPYSSLCFCRLPINNSPSHLVFFFILT